MATVVPKFPFFILTEVRPLTEEERLIVERLLVDQAAEYKSQLHSLLIVGRCGCGVCPTVFFQPHAPGDRELDLVSYRGKDAEGGLVGVALLEKEGVLSQLEFYSIDGHDPWTIPKVETLEPY